MNEKLNGFRMPAEWENQKSVWIAWPYNKYDWPGLYKFIPKVVLEIINKISKYQTVNLITHKKVKNIKKLIQLSKIKNINFHKIKTDRIWLRDSGPIFLINKKSRKKLILDFKFNGWSKYSNFVNDDKITNKISKITKLKKIKPIIKKNGNLIKVIMEGGAFDVNGTGSIILTEECLLSKIQERNKNFKKEDYEKLFNKYLNIKNFIWLKKGIIGDDTHGHVDDISRFVSKNTIMTAIESNKKDKNYKNLNENLKILKKSKNENGGKFRIIKVPMPSPIYIENTRVPASYMNFYICNKKVLLPIFSVKEDIIAIKIFKNFFKNRNVETVDCSKLIWGFGAIHCMTQQEPKI
ncbi:MAG: agmatine deiminase [Pelagibacterales bacterium MED-G44]|nr:MAG: agmatine deiminase [Pelagibacterales bacterium MED-G44]